MGERVRLVVEYRTLVDYLLSIGSINKQIDAVSPVSTWPWRVSLLAMSFIFVAREKILLNSIDQLLHGLLN